MDRLLLLKQQAELLGIWNAEQEQQLLTTLEVESEDAIYTTSYDTDSTVDSGY